MSSFNPGNPQPKSLEAGVLKADLRPLRGRITELWVEGNVQKIEFLVGSERAVFTSSQESQLKEFCRGDLAALQVNSESQIIQAEKLGGAAFGDWNPSGDSMRWRKPTSGLSRFHLLKQRQEILSSIRETLYEQEFLEIETPLLVKGTCPDIEIGAVVAGDGYLVSSTEYQIKRLIVGGFDRVFTLTKNFRSSDRGRFHSSEFTMLEWARSFGSLDEIENDAVSLIQKAHQRISPDREGILFDQKEISLLGMPWQRLTVREAFREYLGLEDVGDFSLDALSRACQTARIEIPSGFENDQHFILSFLLDRIQPHLGMKTPTFLREWPAFMTSSAQVSSRDPFVAERSELYIGGIEISDGFPFLRDPESQRKFFARELERRKEEGKPPVALDPKYVSALAEGIPPGAGMALGVDRLVMVLTGSAQLADIQAFSWDEI